MQYLRRTIRRPTFARRPSSTTPSPGSRRKSICGCWKSWASNWASCSSWWPVRGRTAITCRSSTQCYRVTSCSARRTIAWTGSSTTTLYVQPSCLRAFRKWRRCTITMSSRWHTHWPGATTCCTCAGPTSNATETTSTTWTKLRSSSARGQNKFSPNCTIARSLNHSCCWTESPTNSGTDRTPTNLSLKMRESE